MKAVAFVVLATALTSSIATSQNSRISWSALDMGYSSAVSPTSSVVYGAGQTILGSTRSVLDMIESGFMAGLKLHPAEADSGPAYILYSRSGSPGGSIWMRAVDGSFDTMVTSGSWPRLSHNRRYFLLHKGSSTDPTNRDLDVYDMQRRLDTLLYHQTDSLVGCDWFDDDYHIVFDHACGLLLINRDGSGLTTLYETHCQDHAPVTRPGSWAVAHHNALQGIIVTDSLGVNRHVLVGTGQGDFWPSWSPDGAWISFGHVSPTPDSLLNYYKIRPDGTGLLALTAYSASDRARFGSGGAWSRDGKYLLVPGTVNGENGIYAIATDGSKGIVRIATAPGGPIDFVGSVTGNLDITTDVPERVSPQLPTRFKLVQNYPNPFNPATTIRYDSPRRSHVRLTVYNMLGQRVAELVNGDIEAGFHEVKFDAAGLASGVYLYRMQTDNFVETRKFLLLR